MSKNSIPDRVLQKKKNAASANLLPKKNWEALIKAGAFIVTSVVGILAFLFSGGELLLSFAAWVQIMVVGRFTSQPSHAC